MLLTGHHGLVVDSNTQPTKHTIYNSLVQDDCLKYIILILVIVGSLTLILYSNRIELQSYKNLLQSRKIIGQDNHSEQVKCMIVIAIIVLLIILVYYWVSRMM